MFKKIKELCTFKKEKLMSPTATENKKIGQLKEKVDQQAQQISKLRSRVSNLVDDMHLLNNEMNNFKASVSDDLKNIIESFSNK